MHASWFVKSIDHLPCSYLVQHLLTAAYKMLDLWVIKYLALAMLHLSFFLPPWIQGLTALFCFSLSKQLGFKMFLGVTATVTNWDVEGTSCSIVLEDNPLVDFVELPDTCQGLQYCNLLSGVIRGALEMVGSSFSCYLHLSFFLCPSCHSYY
jgi:hypothetical protein